nr:hypothetical protein [Tanacetum cinerariifolium]
WDLDKLTWEGRVEGYGTIPVYVCAQEVVVERGGFLAGKLETSDEIAGVEELVLTLAKTTLARD